jgi:lactoylglutathione lyase
LSARFLFLIPKKANLDDMPRIEHIALWCANLELMKDFYSNYFGGNANNRYHNPKKGFSSFFLTFDDGSRLELMQREDIGKHDLEEKLGWAHIAFSLGTKEKVDSMTDKFRRSGFKVVGEPRVTGDGYYESVVLDPEGNKIELTV